jgi:hypothetical protein
VMFLEAAAGTGTGAGAGTGSGRRSRRRRRGFIRARLVVVVADGEGEEWARAAATCCRSCWAGRTAFLVSRRRSSPPLDMDGRLDGWIEW